MTTTVNFTIRGHSPSRILKIRSQAKVMTIIVIELGVLICMSTGTGW